MAIPPFREDGWLPERHHSATWEQIVAAFGGNLNDSRAAVLQNLLRWKEAAQGKGLAGRILLNGSFISQSPKPNDFDLIFVYDEATEAILRADPEALALVNPSYTKPAYGGDIFAFASTMLRDYPQFAPTDTFDRVKFTNVRKGVIEVDL